MTEISTVTVDPPAVDGVTHRWIRVGALDVHVASAGNAGHSMDSPRVPIVLVAGWPQHWWCWRHVISLLAIDHTVYAIDLPGQGWTTGIAGGYDKMALAEDLIGTIQALGLPRVDLVGHDWGGWVSLLVAQQRPDLVHRVVTAAIPAPWGRVPAHPRALVRLPAFVYMPLAGGPAGPYLHRRLGQLLIRATLRLSRADRKKRPRAEIEPYLERYRRPDLARAGAMLYRSFLTNELLPYLRGNYSPRPPTVPVLMLVGDRDPAITLELVQTAAAPGRDIHTDVIADCGHLIPEERPKELELRIREFLQ